jgi:hypothetical protein
MSGDRARVERLDCSDLDLWNVGFALLLLVASRHFAISVQAIRCNHRVIDTPLY